MSRWLEGAAAFYTPAAANTEDLFVITVGTRPLLAGRAFPPRAGDTHCGLFSCDFDPSWTTAAAAAMLWQFEEAEGGFYLKNYETGTRLTATGSHAHTREESTDLFMSEEGTLFSFSNEGWLTFTCEDATFCLCGTGQGYFSYCYPTGRLTTITTQSDTALYAAFMAEEKACTVYWDCPEGSVLTVSGGSRDLCSGDKVPMGTEITLSLTPPAGRIFSGYLAEGHLAAPQQPLRICRDTEITPIVSGNGETCLSFIADVHDLPHRLEQWARSLPQEIALSRMIFGGDITAGSVRSIAVQQAAHQTVGEVIARYSLQEPIITVGNHEREYEFRWEGRSVADIYPDTVDFGPHTEANYLVYNYGASEFDHEDFQSNFPAERTAQLEKWLETVPADRPVFLNAHYPLHATRYRPQPCGAAALIAVLNRHPNVICLWGHNHGHDNSYGTIVPRGGEILYDYTANLSAKIGFTYCSHGAMYDAARTVAPYYGLVAKVAADGSRVTLCYYDLSGTARGYKTAAGPCSEPFMVEI